MVEALRARPRLTTVLATLVICAGFSLVFAGETIAAIRIGTYNFSRFDSTGSYYVDSDRSVPEYEAHVPDNPDNPGVHILGVTFTSATVYGPGDYDAKKWIHYDFAQMRNLCADQNDYNRAYAHERAHSRGWRHGEGNTTVNKAYYGTIGGVGGGVCG